MYTSEILHSESVPGDVDVPSLIDSVSRYLRVLGDPTRVRILLYLATNERTVTEIVDALGGPQSRISNHLACLRWCSLVVVRRVGRKAFYSVTNKAVIDLLVDTMNAISPDQRMALCSCTRIGGRP